MALFLLHFWWEKTKEASLSGEGHMTSEATIRRDPDSAVMEVSEATFQRDVVQRSYDVPVVIDFWAPWCGPCRTLGPTLEKLASEASGDWVLAKINVDENPRLAQAFGVQGIPAVKAVSEGKLVEEFTGALPESRVRAWLQGFIVDTDDAQPAALAEIDESDPQEAAARYRVALGDDPDNEDLKLALGRLLLFQRNAEGQALLGEIAPGSPHYARAQAMLTAADFFLADSSAAAASPIETRYLQAGTDVQAGHMEQALDDLLVIVGRDRGFRDDGARKAVLGILAALGDENPLAGEYRRKLANALF